MNKRHEVLRIGLSLASAALLVLGLTSLDASGWIAFVTLVPILLAVQRGTSPWIPALAYATTATAALMFGTHHYGWTLFFVSSALVATFLTVPILAYSWCLRRGATSIAAAWALASIYTSVDYLVSYQTWVPIGRIVATTAATPSLLHGLAFVGPFVTGFGIILANGMLAAAISARRDPRHMAAPIAVASIVVSLFAVPPLAAGEGAPKPPRELTFVVIQGSITRAEYQRSVVGDGVAERTVLDRYFQPTSELLGSADWIIWPETALWRYETARAELNEIMRARPNARLLGGFPVYAHAANGGTVRHNAVLFLNGSAFPVDSYAKRHLVPIAERLFAPGRETSVLQTDVGPVATPICFEAVFARPMLAMLRQDPLLIVVASNEAGFGLSLASHYMLKQAIVHAASARKPLIRAGQSGVSAIVDDTGAVVARTALFERTEMRGAVAPRGGLTRYLSHGDLYLLLPLMLFGVWRAKIHR